jgi:peroxiredoxin
MVRTETPGLDLGAQAPDFELKGVDGNTYTYSDINGPNGTLVMFICNHCPYVKGAIDRIVRDCKELKDVGIGSVAIMSNDTNTYPADSFDNMKKFAAEHEMPFPYLIDETQEVARAYGAVCTPDFFGYNADGELQYRGRIDSGGPTEPEPDARRELLEAMEQIAETGQGPKEQIPSVGCSIKWR